MPKTLKNSVFDSRQVRFKTVHAGLLLVTAPVVFQVFAFAMLDLVILNTRDEFIKVEQKKAMLSNVRMIAFTVSHSFLPMMHLTKENVTEKVTNLLEELKGLKTTVNANLNLSKQSTDIEPIQEDIAEIQSQLNLLENNLLRFLAYEERTPRVFRAENKTAFVMLLLKLEELSDKIVREEHKIKLRSPEELSEVKERFNLILILSAFACAATSGLLTILFNRTFVDGLKTLKSNTAMLTSEGELKVIKSGLEEIVLVNEKLISSRNLLEAYRSRENAIINNSADVLCSLDEKLKFVSIAASCIKSWSYQPTDLLGKSLLAMIDADSSAHFRSNCSSLIDSDKSTKIIEIDMLCGDSKYRTLSWSVNWNSTNRQFVAVVRDVSQKKKLENLKHRFVSMISHDLRTPLSSICASIALIEQKTEGQLSAPIKQQLGKMNLNINRLTDLANEVLDIQKFESGTMQLNLEEVRIYNLCAEAAEKIDSHARTAKVKIIKPKADAAIMADKKRLIQAIVNLLVSALKLSPPGSNITIDVVRVADEVELSVYHQGHGLDSKEAELVFSKSTKINSIPELPMLSSGLGLAFVKAVVEAHGGKAGADSIKNKGNRFWLRLSALAEDIDPADDNWEDQA